MLSFYSRTKAGKRSINKRLNKTEPIAKEKSDICRKNMSYSYETTTAPLSILPSKRQEEPSSYSHVAGSGSKTKGEEMAVLPHVSHTWPASHSSVWHEVLPLLPAIFLGQFLGSHHPCAMACPGLGRRDTLLINGSLECPFLQPGYCWSHLKLIKVFLVSVFNWMTSPCRIL